MYVTGGLGPAHANQGFTFAYDLPNKTAYAETCASIALIFWAQRMFQLDPHRRCIDMMERALYNGVMSGVSYEGEHFFYANPLTSYPHVNPYEHWSGIHTHKHYRREEWFFCACCPPNLARLVAGIGDYFYATQGDTVYVNLYNANTTRVTVQGPPVQITQATHYPWDNTIQISVQPEQAARFTLALRIPEWCSDFELLVNGSPLSLDPIHG